MGDFEFWFEPVFIVDQSLGLSLARLQGNFSSELVREFDRQE